MSKVEPRESQAPRPSPAPNQGFLGRSLLKATEVILDLGPPPQADPDRAGLQATLQTLASSLPKDQRRLLLLGLRFLDTLCRIRFLAGLLSVKRQDLALLFSRLSASRLSPLRRLVSALKMLTQYAFGLTEEGRTLARDDGPWLSRLEIPVHPAAKILVEESR